MIVLVQSLCETITKQQRKPSTLQKGVQGRLHVFPFVSHAPKRVERIDLLYIE